MAATYVILGAPPAEIAEFVRYLLREGVDDDASALVYADESHRPTLGEDPRFCFWDATQPLPTLSQPDAEVLVLPPIEADPRPCLEHLRDWLDAHQRELSRLFTLVDCNALASNESLIPFYDLCLHFSDVFLLANRQDVSKKWIQEYQNQLHKKAVPTLVEMLKKGGRVNDVKALLFPETRRISQFFDPIEELPDLPIEIEGYTSDEETSDLSEAYLDPYLARGEDDRYAIKVKF